MPEPLDPSEGYIRTVDADAELSAPRLGLSLSQRKLLTLVEETRGVADMAAALHSDEARVRRDLARLVDLRLVRAPHAASASPAPDTPRLAAVVPRARVAPRARRRGIGIAIVSVVGVAAAAVVAWPLHERTPSAPAVPASAVGSGAAPVVAAADATGGTIRAAPGPVDSTPAASVAVAQLPNTAAPSRIDARRTPTPEPVRVALPAPQPASTHEVARVDNVARPSAVAAAPAPAATASRPPQLQSNVAPAAQAADDKAAAASVPERTAVTAPVAQPVAPTQAAPTATPNPPARAPTEAPAPVLLANAPASTFAPPAKPRLTPIAREEPEFPREAVLADVTSGRVRARLTVDKEGRVSNVEIVAAEPRRVFDRAVDRALSRWRFEPSAEVRTTDVEVDFKAN